MAVIEADASGRRGFRASRSTELSSPKNGAASVHEGGVFIV